VAEPVDDKAPTTAKPPKPPETPQEPTLQELRQQKELEELEEILSGDNKPACLWAHLEGGKDTRDHNGSRPMELRDVAYSLSDYFGDERDELNCLILLQKHRGRMAKEEEAG
jgi:hypothetical protein